MSRFTIDFSDEAERDLQGLIKALGVKSKADVLRKALNLLNYVVRAQEEGGKLLVENKKDKSRKEVITL
ncbi:MAG: hypothetical protein V3V11_09570 [Vicinamibacteria bacterium]